MEQSMNRYIGQMLDDRYEILVRNGNLGKSDQFKGICDT